MTPKIPPKSIFRALRALFPFFPGPSGPIFMFFGPCGAHFSFFGPCGAFYPFFRALRGLLLYFFGPCGASVLSRSPLGPQEKKRIPRKKKGFHGFGPQIQKKKETDEKKLNPLLNSSDPTFDILWACLPSRLHFL